MRFQHNDHHFASNCRFPLVVFGLFSLLLSCFLAPVESKTIAERCAQQDVSRVVAIIPDRSTAYPNGLHNGLLSSAVQDDLCLEIRAVGGLTASSGSIQVLRDAIDTPSEDQPDVYLIWPVDDSSRLLIHELYERHRTPIIQLNQLPDDNEWDHLLGYAGPDDKLRARNAAEMMFNALVVERQVESPKVIALGYPASYRGYNLSIAAFREKLENTNIEIIHDQALEWGGDLTASQAAFDAMVQFMDGLDDPAQTFHGVYAMDDDILIGAFQALEDLGLLEGPDGMTLVGTVCNGQRDILSGGKQYGTTIQSPFLEAQLAISTAVEYLTFGNITEQASFTPNPIVTDETWSEFLVDFLNETYVADALCTWTLNFERRNGLTDIDLIEDSCEYVDCLYVPQKIFTAGYFLAGINYVFFGGLFLLLWWFRDQKVIKLAQPLFLGLVLVGAMVDTTSIIFMSRDERHFTTEQLDRSCVAWSWLLTLGQMMTTTTLVAKMARVKAVIGIKGRDKKSSLRRTKVNVWEVSGFIVGGMAVDLIILVVWVVHDRFHWSKTVVSRDFLNTILQARGECSSDTETYWVYPAIILSVHMMVLIYGNWLAWQTRKHHKISDSRYVAISLFNSIQLLMVAAIMLSLSGDNVTISYVVRASYAFLNNMGVVLLVVAPKIYRCVFGYGNLLPNLHSSSNNIYGNGGECNTRSSGSRTHISGLMPLYPSHQRHQTSL